MHALGILLILFVRFVLAADANSTSATNRPAVISAGVRVMICVVVFLVLSHGSHPLWAALLLAVIFPTPIVRFVLVPAGVPHVTYLVTRTFWPHSIVEEPVGGSTYYELRARVRRGRALEAEATLQLVRRLSPLFDEVKDLKVRGATLTARAMLDTVRGNTEGARELFAVVQDMRGRHAARSARAFSQSFLLADAAERGAHHEVVRLASRGPRTRRRAFLRASALRLLGRPERSSDVGLRLLWLVTPGRLESRVLLKQALAAPIRAELEVDGDDLAAATVATTRLLSLPRGFATRRELFRVARAWQAVLERGEVRSWLGARRDALEATFDVTGLEASFERDLVELFAELLQDTLASEEPEGEEPWLVTSAKDALQSELLAELESVAGALPRGDSRNNEGYDHHWRTWAHVRRLITGYLDSLPDRRHVIYDSVGTQIFNYGAWLHNDQDALLLAHDVFRFLLLIVPPDAEDHKTLKNNVAIAKWL